MKRSMTWALLLAVALSWTAAAEERAPRFDGLGRHRHPVTTRWKLAQRYFDQGLTLCFNFNHAEAIRSFQAAAQVDPECAMAWWGIAYAYGPNINMPMADEAVPKAWAALQEAMRLRGQASAAERAYIEALAKRYTNAPVADRSALDAAYADAMREVARTHPDDLDAHVLFAEALMDLAPWNYWQPDQQPKPAAREAIAVIESVLARVKAHSGADHLYIHLVEAGPHPEKGVPSADRIGRLTPKAGHLVHMASHIYVRVGRYHDAATVNERAVEVDEDYLDEVKPTGTYPGGYYPHNVHFLWYATDLEGRSRDALAAARKVSQFTLDLRCGAIEGPRQRYLPVLAMARFGRWEEILKEPAPADEYPFDRAMWHYARGLALVGLKQTAAAAAEQQRFEALRGDPKVKAVDSPYFPALQVLSVAGHVLAGKVASGQGRAGEAVEHYRRAVATEDTIPYMEPPYWYYSARLTLAAGLLQAGRAAEAEREFRAELKEFPRNGWPLFGLERSLQAQGKDLEAREVAAEFKQAWKHADTPLELQWF